MIRKYIESILMNYVKFIPHPVGFNLQYTENSISLRQRYRIINLSKTYERYMYRY